MEPTISSGSLVLVFKKSKYNVNDIVVVSIEQDLSIIKRVISIHNQRIKLSGDNYNKSSSLCDPWYCKDRIQGKVIFNSSSLQKIIKVKEPSRIS
mgnify:FL=1